MKLRLDKKTKRRLVLKKKAEWACKKLTERAGLTVEQRASFKQSMAEGMRLFPTKAEAKITSHLKGLGFEPQIVVLGFIPDFTHRDKRIIVEIDGSVHNSTGTKETDRRKDLAFRVAGWKVMRFTNELVMSDLLFVVRQIKAACI